MAKELSRLRVAYNEARKKEAAEYTENMRPHLLAVLESGVQTDRRLALHLNRQGLRVRTGARWTESSVAALRARLGFLSDLRPSRTTKSNLNYFRALAYSMRSGSVAQAAIIS